MKLFLIDDVPDTLEFLSYSLHKKGHEVFSFTSPKSALKQMEFTNPDVVITDYQMPEINGIELINEVRTQKWGQDTGCILMSCYDMEMLKEEIPANKRNTFINKSFKIDDLMLTINQVMST